jgi:hypothetical protein
MFALTFTCVIIIKNYSHVNPYKIVNSGGKNDADPVKGLRVSIVFIATDLQ